MKNRMFFVVLFTLLASSVSQAAWLEHLTWEEADNLNRDSTIFILVAGSTEQHGQRLELNNDTFYAQAIAEALADSLPNAFILPVLPYGTTDELMAFPGTISISPETYQNVIHDILGSMISHGFNKFLVVNYHGPNHQPIQKAIAILDSIFPDITIINPAGKIFLNLEYTELCKNLFQAKLAHGNEVETAMTETIPGSVIRNTSAVTGVGPDYFPPRDKMPTTPEEWQNLIPLGHFGNPRRSNPDQGKILNDWIINQFLAEAQILLK